MLIGDFEIYQTYTGAVFRPKMDQLPSVSSANTQFSIDIYKTIIKTKSADENVFLSPFSIMAALAMVNVGAQGSTRDEILATTKLNGFTPEQINNAFKEDFTKLKVNQHKMKPAHSPKAFQTAEPPTLILANRVYAQQGMTVMPTFTTILTDDFNSSLGFLDFAKNLTGAKDEVSRWVEDVTNRKIKNMGDSLDEDTVMALISAIYFKAQWADPFKTWATKNGDFFASNGKTACVPFMNTLDKHRSRYAEFDDLECKGLLKPYAGAEVNTIVILPNKKDGLAALEQKLSSKLFDRNSYKSEVIDIQLPKFRIEDSMDLKTQLVNMGMVTPFTLAADFSGISERFLMISKVIHKTFIGKSKLHLFTVLRRLLSIKDTSVDC